MSTFAFSRERIDAQALRERLADPAAGGYASFEGWVRDHNEGLAVRHLEYEAFEPLAISEGERIVAQAISRFGVEHAACVHRSGALEIGEMAVWVGVSARHRHEAFLACRYIIDEIKHRLPIWKKEHYTNGDSGWVNCERCATAPGDVRHVEPHVHAEHAAPGPIPDYSRQMALKQVGPAGQAKLRAARVLVVGCGGLGVPVMSYLAGAGVGRLGLVDSDRLQPSNLHRQTWYALAECGQLKAELAAERVHALNPDVDVRKHVVRLDAGNVAELIGQYDLVIDCTDNFASKFLLNDWCVRLGKPAIFASVYQFEGQLQVVRSAQGSACLRCIWPEAVRDGIVGNCSEAGVLGPVPGIFGGLQAFEALRLLLDLPGQPADELLIIDLLNYSISRLRTARAASCPEHALERTKPASAAAADLEASFASLEAAAGAGFTVVDIRELDETRDAPLPFHDVRHVPLAQLVYGKTAAVRGKTLLVCASGRRSLAAAQELRSRGLPEVYSLRGGLQGLQSRSLS
ncbi:MAG TPA: ThiF family adenylyltransferase [Steroidobacteraceae bacterium]